MAELINAKNNSGNSSQLYWVKENVIKDDFPPVRSALRDPDGLLAIGGDLSTSQLLTAYRRGIFPWYSEGQPVLWWSPNPRCVLIPENIRISRSLKRTLRKEIFEVSYNRCFADVVNACANPRKNDAGTWITDEMFDAYHRLHMRGHALSVECRHNDKLVGGLYGVFIGKVFFGESMFSFMNDASKVALVHLCRTLKEHGFKLIDCQVFTSHLQSLGAEPMPREAFVNVLESYCDRDSGLTHLFRY